jgi:NADH:ubiquinone oxidoreductase subunit F (NADH-binding)
VSTTLSPRSAGSIRAANRILLPEPATTWRDHLQRYGPLAPPAPGDLITAVDHSGLRGRGGAGFPTAVKLKSVAANVRRRRPVVVANGTEGEPASAKDKVLLRIAPHLVLDGMAAAVSALGAERAVLCIDRRDREAIASANRALAERAGHDRVPISVAETPSRYVAGEETALVAWLNGGPAKPTFAPPRPSERGVGGVATLIDNVETLAHIGLIARFGPEWWKSVGSIDEPGTMLVTVRGAVTQPGVYEFPIGTPISQVLAGAGAGAYSAVLVGGYFGSWITAAEARGADLSSRSLQPLGATAGCGLLAVMPSEHCPLQETSRVLSWLAANSAGQCGACINGLPALAGAFEALVDPRPDVPDPEGWLDRWSPMVAGRGACKLPDGAIRFLGSARRVFASHIAHHRYHGSCPPNPSQILPTPALGGWK